MKKNKLLIYLMLAISITLCIPSVVYLINNKTVSDFNTYYSYTIQKYTDTTNGVIQGAIFIGLILIFSIIYILILKKEEKLFSNKKQVIIFIFIISLLFAIMLPILGSDIFYYIGDSWLSAKYGENPYYTTVYDLQQKGINDEILQTTGYWKNTTSVYGPIWNIIAKILVSLSFGNVTAALYIFKIANLAVHMLNCYMIYKVTQKNKYVLMYGLNPLVLSELLSNVHNDIYLIAMVLIALYFLIKKKNVFIMAIFMSLSIAIKYSTALLVPFLLLYYYKDKTIPKKTLYCFLVGIGIIILVAIMYLPYYKDISIYTNMLVQNERFSQSIMATLLKKADKLIFNIINSLRIPTFLVVYITSLITMLFKKEIKIEEICNKYSVFMLIFIFLVIINFQRWYLVWLFPTIFWTNKYIKEFIIANSITSVLPLFIYFRIGNDAFRYGIYNSTITVFIAIIICSIGAIKTRRKEVT